LLAPSLLPSRCLSFLCLPLRCSPSIYLTFRCTPLFVCGPSACLTLRESLSLPPAACFVCSHGIVKLFAQNSSSLQTIQANCILLRQSPNCIATLN
jgi:hypothetical protein